MVKRKQSLYQAVVEQSAEKVRRLLHEDRSRVSERTDDNETALHAAAFDDTIEIGSLLIQGGAAVNADDLGGRTPLHFAAQNGSLRMADLLIQHGADIDATTKSGCTPLYLSTRHTESCRRVSEILIAHNARLDLNSALRLGLLKEAHAILQSTADIESRALFSNELLIDAVRDTSGQQVLTAIVEEIIEKGAPVNGMDSSGETAVMFAARNKHLDESIYQVLMRGGAEIDVYSPVERMTARQIAKRYLNTAALRAFE